MTQQIGAGGKDERDFFGEPKTIYRVFVNAGPDCWGKSVRREVRPKIIYETEGYIFIYEVE